jgi:hypothetical protein
MRRCLEGNAPWVAECSMENSRPIKNIKYVQEQLENAGAQVTPPGAVTLTARGGGYSTRAPAAAAPAKTIGGAGLDGAGIGRLGERSHWIRWSLGDISAGSGHATTALSLAHLIAVLMYRVMWGRSLGMRTVRVI